MKDSARRRAIENRKTKTHGHTAKIAHFKAGESFQSYFKLFYQGTVVEKNRYLFCLVCLIGVMNLYISQYKQR